MGLIAQFRGDTGFTLLYLDGDGTEQADTWHASLDDAFKQAKGEFRSTTASGRRL